MSNNRPITDAWVSTGERWKPTPVDLNASGVTPLDLRVVVKPDSAETKTPGGIILPESKVEQEKFAIQKATLVAIGENAWEEAKSRITATPFKAPEVGDRVMIGKYSGTRFKGVDGEDYVLLNDDDIVGRLSE